MKDELELWNEYFWDTKDKVLKNKLGLRDEQALQLAETRITQLKTSSIEQNKIPIEKTFDAQHLKAIHRALFEEVYEWAGEYRTVFMTKQGIGFAEIHEIDQYLNNAAQIIARTDWMKLNKKGFVHKIAEVYGHLNIAHPFREGNGRASKLFVQHVADQSKFEINFDPKVTGITPQIWNAASMHSMNVPNTKRPELKMLKFVFDKIVFPNPKTEEEPKQNSFWKFIKRTQQAPEQTRNGHKTPGETDGYTPPMNHAPGSMGPKL